MYCIRKQIAKIGDTGGRLTVIAEPFKRIDCGQPKVWWVRCRCSCGRETITRERYLFNGNTRSCGCLHKESSKRTGDQHRHKGWVKSRTHAQSKTLLYGVWVQMKARCDNPNNKSYHRYGGRGISVCSDWSTDFTAFRGWADANGYRKGMCIDRIDSDKGYEPANCRWVSGSVNSRHMVEGRMKQIEALKAQVRLLEAKLEGMRHG